MSDKRDPRELVKTWPARDGITIFIRDQLRTELVEYMNAHGVLSPGLLRFSKLVSETESVQEEP